MQYLIATTFEVVHYIALQAVHYKPLQEVHLSRYNQVIGESSRGNDGRCDFAEDLLTFLGFALLYAWLIWSANYIRFSLRTYNAEALSRLHPAGYYLSYIPLFGAVWYGVRIRYSGG